MIGPTHRAAIVAGIVALAVAVGASAQTSSSSRSLRSGTSSMSSTSSAPGMPSTVPATRPLGALTWIEQTRTRLGTIDPVRRPGAPDAASAASPTAASMAAAATAKRRKSGTDQGGGGMPTPLWQSAGGGMGATGGVRSRTFGRMSGN